MAFRVSRTDPDAGTLRRPALGNLRRPGADERIGRLERLRVAESGFNPRIPALVRPEAVRDLEVA